MLENKFDAFVSGVLDELDRLHEALNTEQILDEVGAMLLNRIRTRFLAETAPDGSKWIPSRAAIRRRKKGGTGTLYDTGRLFRSLQLAALGPGERKLFTDVPYGPLMHYGFEEFTVPFPPRHYMEINDEDIELAERLIMRRIEGVNA